jgi:predicted Zn-dependent protease
LLTAVLVLSVGAAAQAPQDNAPSAPTTASIEQIPINQVPRVALEAAPLPPRDESSSRREDQPHGKYDVRRIGARGIGGGVNFYSLEREQALGRELSQEVESESRLISDPVITEYVNRVGQNVVRNSDSRVPFTIKVLDNEEINAFALPGGFFYVNSGLILAADNESQLAGVMAHEIAHVAARHATKTATRSQILNLASIPLIFVGGPAGYAVRQAMRLAVPMSFLKFSRDAEREADLLGLEYAYAAGYDPAEFVQFFEALRLTHKKQKHSFLAKAFSTHPMTDDRIHRAQKEIDTMLPPRDEYLVDTSEFSEIKLRLAQLTRRGMINGGNAERPTFRRCGPETKDDNPNGPRLRRLPADEPSPPATEAD